MRGSFLGTHPRPTRRETSCALMAAAGALIRDQTHVDPREVFEQEDLRWSRS